MKKVILCLFIVAVSVIANGQIGAGVNLGFNRYPDADKSFLMYGVHGMYGGIKDGKINLRGMFSTGGYRESVEGLSESTDLRFRMSFITLDALYNFKEGSMEDGGLYAAPGLGFAIANSELGNESGSASQIYIRGLFGYTFVTDGGLGIFGEGYLNIPPNSNSEGESVEVNIYGTLGVNFGVRKNF